MWFKGGYEKYPRIGPLLFLHLLDALLLCTTASRRQPLTRGFQQQFCCDAHDFRTSSGARISLLYQIFELAPSLYLWWACPERRRRLFSRCRNCWRWTDYRFQALDRPGRNLGSKCSQTGLWHRRRIKFEGSGICSGQRWVVFRRRCPMEQTEHRDLRQAGVASHFRRRQRRVPRKFLPPPPNSLCTARKRSPECGAGSRNQPVDTLACLAKALLLSPGDRNLWIPPNFGSRKFRRESTVPSQLRAMHRDVPLLVNPSPQCHGGRPDLKLSSSSSFDFQVNTRSLETGNWLNSPLCPLW